MKALAVIPARGGSKRVPGKNLRLLRGKPLIAWTIEAAQVSGVPFVVSTEDEEITAVAVGHGAQVLPRPAALAGDDTPTGAVLAHAVEQANGDYDAVICLHPTSPIRDPEHIRLAVKLLGQSDLNYLASVREIRRKTHANVGIMDGPDLRPLTYERPVFVLNASIYGIKREELLRSKSHVGYPAIPLIMDERHSVDIDTEEDFAVAEALL